MTSPVSRLTLDPVGKTFAAAVVVTAPSATSILDPNTLYLNWKVNVPVASLICDPVGNTVALPIVATSPVFRFILLPDTPTTSATLTSPVLKLN